MIRDIDETQAPLLDHLLELRTRLLRCVYALAATFAVCFYFADDIFALLARPLMEAFPPGQGKLIYTKLYEAFFVELKVSLFAAFLLSFRSSPTSSGPSWRRGSMRGKRRRSCRS
jgi:sec-independent protein translocase protein TatC